MTPAELVGRRLKEARIARHLSQRRVGELLAPYLGVQWSPQAVSAAEKGRRRFDVTDLVALSAVLQRPVTWFVLPEGADQDFEMPGDLPVRGAGFQPHLADADVASLRTFLIRFAERNADAVALLEDALDALREVAGLARPGALTEEVEDQVERRTEDPGDGGTAGGVLRTVVGDSKGRAARPIPGTQGGGN